MACLLLMSGAYAQKDKKKKKNKGKQTIEAPAKPALRNQADSLSYAIGINIGSNINNQQIDSLNVDMLTFALKTAVKKDTLLMTEMQAMSYLQTYFQAHQARMVAKGKAEGEKFLAENKTKPGIVTTGTGLQYLVLKDGTGGYPKPTDKVKVHYVGTLLSGKQFDSSIDRGEPAEFPVNQVIKGWTEALQMMKVGSKWRIFLPSDLAYGDQGTGGDIPPNSVLIFEVELLEILK